MTQFLIDAQLPPALARWLSSAGYTAQHVSDIGLGDATDSRIWDYAVASNAIVVSKDEDFAQRKVLSNGGPFVVWVRLRNTRKRELLIWFEAKLPEILAAISRGETLIEIV